jgi:hypothetical protein
MQFKIVKTAKFFLCCVTQFIFSAKKV